ncbi:Deoxyhypusine hydroxylase [Aix galericulata]|nr:Deoxyhypusine hydroxylase [Aix galericulata]
MVTEEQVAAVGRTLLDAAQPLPARFRALFTLRGLGGPEAVACIGRAFGDGSELLKHELAYCLGQMRDEAAIPVLLAVLRDARQEPMVRHEAGEALGAIGNPAVLDVLKQYSEDPVVEVAETCQLAVKRLEWLQEHGEEPSSSPYQSVDPAPPAEERDVAKLREALLDEARPLFDRYQAMFALRNLGGRDAVLALADGLQAGSALFRHEIGYVLGQMQDEACVPQLTAALRSRTESPMVRHECAEALGAIAHPSCLETLRAFAQDEERVVRESCEVALDMPEPGRARRLLAPGALPRRPPRARLRAQPAEAELGLLSGTNTAAFCIQIQAELLLAPPFLASAPSPCLGARSGRALAACRSPSRRLGARGLCLPHLSFAGGVGAGFGRSLL